MRCFFLERDGNETRRKYRAMGSPAKRRRARRREDSRTLDTEAALAPVSCCLAAGTNWPQRALAVVRSIVARQRECLVRCGRTARSEGTGREPGGDISARNPIGQIQ